MSEQDLDIVHYIDIPSSLFGKLKPRALQVFSRLIGLCSRENPYVLIDQETFGNSLGIHRETAGRWVRHLVQNEYLIFLGYQPHDRRKHYQINFAKILEENSKYPSDQEEYKKMMGYED